MHIAIIDLGTNTFNLLVADLSHNGRPNILHRSKYASKIGKGGITNHHITEEAMQRGLMALEQMLPIIRNYNVEQTHAIATSAFRSAENASTFTDLIEQRCGITVQIISGEREAELIYQGTKQAINLNHEKVAILDIGGGSNEVIIADSQKIFWKKSFPLGITRLLEQFNPSEPITREQIKEIENYLNSALQELFDINDLYNVKTLIGSSGSFDTFRQMLISNGSKDIEPESTHYEIKLKDFFHIHQRIMASSNQERKEMPGMDLSRVDLMPLASLFIHFIIQKMGISKLYQSSYALKEGVLLNHQKLEEKNPSTQM